MHISSLKMLNKCFCLLLFSWLTVWGTLAVALAEESETPAQKAALAPASQIIVINPDTGEIDPSAKTIPAKLTRETTRTTTAQEKFTYHDDGSVIVDFNGKFMKPVYGHLEDNGKLQITHGQGGKEQ